MSLVLITSVGVHVGAWRCEKKRFVGFSTTYRGIGLVTTERDGVLISGRLSRSLCAVRRELPCLAVRQTAPSSLPASP